MPSNNLLLIHELLHVHEVPFFHILDDTTNENEYLEWRLFLDWFPLTLTTNICE